MGIAKYRPGQFVGELVQQRSLEGKTFSLLDARITEGGEFGPSALCQIEMEGVKYVAFLNGAVVLPTIQGWMKDPQRKPERVLLSKTELDNGKSLWELLEPPA